MRCHVTEHRLRCAPPLMTASGTIQQRVVWVFAIDDGSGRRAYGEAAPLVGYGGEQPAACLAALTRALTTLTSDIANAWFGRDRPDAPLGPQLENALRDAPCARHAVEGALLDLMAQRAGKPLADLLAGAPVERRVPVNALLDGPDSFGLLTRAKELVAAGFTTFKVKSSGDPLKDADRLRALREMVGAQARLRLDVNATWTQAQALAFVEAAQGLDLEWCEQPLAVDDLAGHGLLRRSGLRIALDESVRAPGDVARVAAVQAADAIVLKPQFLGGWRATLQAAELARSLGLEVVLASAMDGAIGRANAAHMAAALKLTQRAHGLATGDRFAVDLVSAPLPVASGALHLDPAPGLGVGTLREKSKPAKPKA